MSVCVSTAQVRTKVLGRGLRIYLGRGIVRENSRVKLFWHVHAHFDRANSHNCGSWPWNHLVCGILPKISSIKVFLVACPCDILVQSLTRFFHDLAQALLKRSCSGPAEKSLCPAEKIFWWSWRNPAKDFSVISRRHLCEHLVRILLKSSMKSLHDFAKVLLKSFCGDPSEKLSCLTSYKPLWEVLVIPSQNPASRRSCKIFVRSWEDPSEMLPKASLHDLAQVSARRFCGDPVEILLQRSLQ